MTVLDKVPDNLNQLSKLSFRFFVKKLPHVNFFLQTVEMPDVSLPAIDVATPLSVLPWPSGRIAYGQLAITFKVDADMKNYNELYNWIRGMGHPNDLSEYHDIAEPQKKLTGDGIFSDVSLMLLTNIKNCNVEVVYRDAIPVYLSGLSFGSNEPTVSYATASARFRYVLFDVNTLPQPP